MTTLELAESRVPMRRVGSEWHGPCPDCGAGKSGERHTDRFSVKADGRFFCRICTPEGGDAVKFLRKFEGKSCPEAHEALGKACDFTGCPVREKCRMGDKAPGVPTPRSLAPPRAGQSPAFVPAEVIPPAERWLRAAEKLVETAHAALLAHPEQLAYLAGRGLPREAVEKYHLGWISDDLFRPRSTWGLSEEFWDGGKTKKLKIHRGVLIPTFVDERPHRLRVRRPKEDLKEGEPGYIEVKGSGNDRVILNPAARAVVVIESDLDALLIDWLAGDIVGAMPTVSASAKPKESTWPILQQALCILVASDYEPVWDEASQRWTNVGGSAAQWWRQQFSRAKRWPVPAGKDPGEAYQQGVDIRAWILAGLPPVFHLPVVPNEPKPATPPPAAAAPPVRLAPIAEPVHGVSAGGRPFIIVNTRGQFRQMTEQHPGVAVVGRSELGRIDPEATEAVLMVKGIFPGCEVLRTDIL
jgi:hypothetical protein